MNFDDYAGKVVTVTCPEHRYQGKLINVYGDSIELSGARVLYDSENAQLPHCWQIIKSKIINIAV